MNKLIEAASAFCRDCGRFSCNRKYNDCPSCTCGLCLGACYCECYCGLVKKTIEEQLADFTFSDFEIWNLGILTDTV